MVRPFIRFLVQKKTTGCDHFSTFEEVSDDKYAYSATYQQACSTALYGGELNSVSLYCYFPLYVFHSFMNTTFSWIILVFAKCFWATLT